jgi:hypothetical protein
MLLPFIVDTNFFIQAYRQHYPFDVVPSFWLKVKELAERGIIMSIDKVKDELYGNNDALTSWCKDNLPADFFKDTTVIISQYSQISNWANSRNDHFTPQALSEFLHADEADAWLVSYALANGNKIITHEVSDPNSKKRIKIPDACSPFNINCLNTIDMFRELGEAF